MKLVKDAQWYILDPAERNHIRKQHQMMNLALFTGKKTKGKRK